MSLDNLSKQRPKLHERIFLACFCAKAEVDGLKIRVLRSDRKYIPKIQEALRFIKDRDPIRYNWLIRDLDLIWIEPLIVSVGEFNPPLNACVIDDTYVDTASPEEIASLIVHEATHARLWRRGIGYPETLRYRIEQICMRQQLVFARKASLDEEIRKGIEFNLAITPDYWTNAKFAERWNVDSVSKAREAGLPDWLINTLIRLGKARNRRLSRRTKAAAAR